MTPQELKNSILQLAIQGKLVEQRPGEGTAAELLQKILAAKNAKGAKGNLTRSRGGAENMSGGSRSRATKSRAACRAPSVPDVSVVPFVPSVPDDEKPFDIPESWEWVRLGDVFNIVNGFTPLKSNPEFWTNGDIPWFTINDVHRQGRFITTTEKHITKKALAKGSERIVPSDTVLLCCTASIGEYAFTKISLTTNQQFNALVVKEPYQNLIDPLFVLEFVKTLKGKLIELAGKTTFNFVSVGKVSKILFPLPPLAEQKRIVAKIEELLPLIDRYEKAWSKLEDFNKRFPVDMQKSLLQMAIQGKLVEQRPEEGTAAELLEKILATKNAKSAKKNLTRSRGTRGENKTSAPSASPREEISDDEIPFEIPESWVWVRLSSVTDMLSGFAFKSTDFKANGKYRLLRGINLGVDDVRWKETVCVDYITERMAEYRLKSGDVLIGLDRPWISDGTRVAIFNDSKETYLVQRVLRLRETGLLTSAFIALLLRSSLLSNSIGDKTTGISVPHISPGQVGNLVVPLPPLAEQKRIVAKLEEILPLCERLR